MERNNKELYDRLGVTPDATQDELKKAYRTAARKLLHASHGDSKENEDYFKNAAEAYNILSNEQLRGIYDREGLNGVHNFQEEEKNRRNLDNLWNYGPPLGSRTPLKNTDSKYTIYATLEDFYFGSVKQLNFTRCVICPSCKGSALSSADVNDGESSCGICAGTQTIEVSGTLPIDIQRGYSDGFSLLLSGKGSQDNPKLAPGNLIIITKQIDHPTFKREESKLILDVSLPLAQFTNGFEITFKHLGGYVVVGKSEPNIALYDGSIFRLRGEGMPNKQQRGDLFLRFHEPDSDSNNQVFIGNKIELIHEMPCETETRHVTAEQVDEIPADDVAPQCAQQ